MIAGLLAAALSPYLLWVNIRMLWKGEIFLTDDNGKITSQYSRAAHPLSYWILMACNLALLVGIVALAAWTFGVLKISH